MKRIYYLLIILTGVTISNCGKESPLSKGTYAANDFADSAIQFLKSRLSKEDFAALDIQSLNTLKYKEANVALRISQKGTSGQRFIMLHKSLNDYDGNWVDLSKLVKNVPEGYNGKIKLTTLENTTLNEFTIHNNHVVNVLNPPKESESFNNSNAQLSKIDISTPDNPEMLDAVLVTGYKNAISMDFMSLYWMFDQMSSFESMYTPDFGSGVGSFTNDITIAPKFISPDHPITDIKKELKCFTIESGATYSVSVNVNQPDPNSRDLTNLTSKFVAGHSYLTLQEKFSNGSTMVRNVGFYPATGAKPGNEVSNSALGDDSNTPYSVSLQISVSAGEFEKIRTAVNEQQNFPYMLQSYNCTGSIFYVMNAINVQLPATIGSNGLFSGYNPADLGQDIREMNLQSFSAENGGRKVVRNVSSNNTLKPPARSGECK